MTLVVLKKNFDSTWDILLSLELLNLFSRCVYVDAGVAPIDIETKKRKEEMKAREAQGRAVAEHGDLALITVEAPQVTASEKISLRPPMLQVCICMC
jgi:hypothetical protein